MKLLKRISVYLILVLMTGQQLTAQSGKHFFVKKGTIEYRFSGDFTGKEIFCFDDFGLKENHLKELISNQKQQKTKTLTIINNAEKTEKDLITGKTLIFTNNNFDSNEFEDEISKLLEAGNFSKTGTEIIAGQPCEKYMGDMGTLSVWKGIILKSEITVADKKIIKTAISVDTLAIIPENKFKIKE